MIVSYLSYEVIDNGNKKHQIRSIKNIVNFDNNDILKIYNRYNLVKVMSINQAKKLLLPPLKTS